MNEIIKKIEEAQLKETVDDFKVGDTVRVHAKIKEGNRERIQVFEGVVLKRQGGVKADESIIDEKEFMEKLPETAKNAIGDACTGSNPRQPSQEEMEKLLKACYYDLEIDF